ncbi:MAG: BMP family ABC transporter substrate-binding protein, partial [Erysipelotrichaceae bacterium]
FICVLACFTMAVSLAGCGGKDKKKNTKEIMMITNSSTIDDKSFNQGTYEGVKAFGDKNKVSYDYIRPRATDKVAYDDAVDLAVKNGAKVIITPGFVFEPTIVEKQDQYKNVKFILIDGYPNNGKYDETRKEKTAKNTVSIKYSEEQSGYLAGYAAVIDGSTKLGFMGGIAVPAIVNFGYGFLQGVDAAAKELGVETTVKYHYTSNFIATPEAQTKAAGWYKEGIETIFACGGTVGNSVMAAAEANDPVGKVIGVDVDQSAESETVITSACKFLAKSVEDQLTAIYNKKFQGGSNLILGAKEGMVGIPMKTSKFTKFTEKEYEAIYKRLAAGEIKLVNSTEVKVDDAGAKILDDNGQTIMIELADIKLEKVALTVEN